jgi:hypothetical protein
LNAPGRRASISPNLRPRNRDCFGAPQLLLETADLGKWRHRALAW